jgi:site-specific recombinase XerD
MMDQLQLPLFASPQPTQTPTPPVPTLKATASLSNATKDYLSYLATAAFSPNTVRNFACDIAMLQRFLGPDRPIGSITPQLLHTWVSELNRSERALSAKSISRRIAATRHFFAWLSEQGALPTNPADDIPCRRVVSPLPLILTDPECEQLRALASENIRTQLIVELLLATGMKKGELTALRLTHFELAVPNHPMLRIQHAGDDARRNRTLALPTTITPLLTHYREDYKIEDKLFDCTDRNLEYILKGLGSRLGVDKRVSAQILRDTFAAQQLKQGIPIEEVLRMLGLAPMEWNGDIRDKYLKLAGLLT